MGDPVIAGDVLRHYTDPVIGKYVDLDGLKPEQTQNFGKAFQELIADIAFVSHLIDQKGKSEILIITEHKSTPEPFVPLQLLVYLVFTWYKRWCDAGRPQSTKKFRLPAPVLVVLYNGKTDWKGTLSIKDLVASVPPELAQFIPEVKIILIRLNQFDIRNLPGKPETQAVIESMIRATAGTFVSGLESVLGHFRCSTLDGRISELIMDIVQYCDWVEEVTHEQVDRAIQNVIEGQEGIKMSQAVEAVRKAFSNMVRDYDRAEGRAEGIVRVLNRRFKAVPKSIEKKIYTIKDIDQLDELTDQAVDCQSLNDFTKSLRSQER